MTKSNLSIFYSVSCAFGILSRKPLPNPKKWRFIPMFSSKSFIVLVLTFRSMTYFELIFLILFIFWLHRVLAAAHGIFPCGTWAPRCGAWAPERVGSLVVARRLSCPTACGILVPWPGIEPASTALQDGFLTTGPPGKPLELIFIYGVRVQLYSLYVAIQLSWHHMLCHRLFPSIEWS